MEYSDFSKSEYLRQLSQSAYNLIIILDLHLAKEHYFDKRLDQFYTDNTKNGGEREKFFTLLDNPVKTKTFNFKKKVLDRYLISNSCDDEKEIKKIKKAKLELISLIKYVQEERKKDDHYVATTGLNDGELKDYIISIIKNKKKEYNLSLLGILEDEKRQRVYLPKFPRTDWAKVKITFIDEMNGLISDSIETKPLTPDIIGCIDGRTGKPKGSWTFLTLIARKNGDLEIGKSFNETTRKKKAEITDILRTIFQNDTDPFENDRKGSYRAKFRIFFQNEANDNDITQKNNKFSENESFFDEMTKGNPDYLEYDVKNNLN